MNQNKKCIEIHPFIKWAGGKGQTIELIASHYPSGLGEGIRKYCEPFVGGGAVLFDILTKHNMQEILINDLNRQLINAFIQVKSNAPDLIKMLRAYQELYNGIGRDYRKLLFYRYRDEFNSYINGIEKYDPIRMAALFIFLNRTCFNGLYRVNSKGNFNVPMGSYKNPTICNEENILRISEKLQEVTIQCEDYWACLDFVDKDTFVYIDPPYRPLSKTASFTGYTDNDFNDGDQIRLKEFIDSIDSIGAKFILSNSDPKNVDQSDSFFDDLYEKYRIIRIKAKRLINCDSQERGSINELLIKNF